MTTLVRVRHVEPAGFPYVRVIFTNDEHRTIDLTPYLGDGPIFAPLRTNPALFQAVQVQGGTLSWPNGADIDPDVLYYAGSPPWAQPEQSQPNSATTPVPAPHQ